MNIHYQTEGHGPDLVLMHWSFASLESWYEFGYVDALKDHFRLILIDARGHGLSDKPHQPEAYALPERVSDITAVLDDLGVAKAAFLGYSMGGWIGFGAAKYAPQRFSALILGGQHAFAQSMAGLRQDVRYALENGAEKYAEMNAQNFPPARRPAERQRSMRNDFEALLALTQDRDTLEDILPSIAVPCLLYAGENDSVLPLAQESARRIPHAQFISIPGLDHGGVIEHPETIVPQIIRFLKSM